MAITRLRGKISTRKILRDGGFRELDGEAAKQIDSQRALKKE